ncbi:TetR/AcrR family transcriptional regulator [Aliiroseovarius crassostreae]|uniref:TetR/AcrR family transcriptional regulator n=1 Tax=Aliiroseovarius crassostreae TaxID=154981 RepID=UPI003C79FB00
MEKQRKSFSREGPEQRRADLILATLDLIGESGFNSATVRAISVRAEVTQGLIRHYFSTKEDLINAAYAHHMSEMTGQGLLLDHDPAASALVQLRNIVVANLTAPVLDEKNLVLWASFIGKIRNEPGIRDTHKQTYLQFREGLQECIAAALHEAGRDPSETECRRLAIACNAQIDGLWMEGCSISVEFSTDEIVEIGLASIGALLGLDLKDAA